MLRCMQVREATGSLRIGLTFAQTPRPDARRPKRSKAPTRQMRDSGSSKLPKRLL